MRELAAPAKINLALVVGPKRPDGKHELATVYQRVSLADHVALTDGNQLEITGFEGDTLVREALIRLAEVAGVEARWTVRLDKRIPVAAGLAGGSSNAASALRLANDTLADPLSRAELHALAASVGADVPFFLEAGPQLGVGDGTELSPLDLPQDYWVVLLRPEGAHKTSTADVYAEFDRREGEAGFETRRRALLAGLESLGDACGLRALPPNDLASSPSALELERAGAFRADVSGAGPAVYGLFRHEDDARSAARSSGATGDIWVAAPTWYG